jgi:hypothetical protein
MSENFNEKEMREELIQLYEDFLKHPEDKFVIQRIISYEKKYGGLSTYNDYLKSKPIPQDIETALNWLSSMSQFNKYEDNHPLANDKILERAKKILIELKKKK